MPVARDSRRESVVAVTRGRRGVRRLRVEECLGALFAEEVYRALIADYLEGLQPDGKGTVTWPVGGREHVIAWSVHSNAVWRYGRVFLLCPKCADRVARIYVPAEAAAAACRRCWGLSYASRARHYAKGLPARAPGCGRSA